MNIKIDKARDWSLRTPAAIFYGVLASNLRDVSDSSIPTACTDGKMIRWNEKFLSALTDEEVRFVLLHEAMHCGLGHFWRLPVNADGNRAGDYAINMILHKIPGLKMPSGGLLDARFDGMAEEEILSVLLREKKKQNDGQKKDQQQQSEPKNGQQADEGGCGGFTEAAEDVGEEEMQEKWEGAVMQADFVSKTLGQGSAPGEMQRMIDAVKIQSVSWKNEMADFIRSSVSCRSDWSRSSRRMATASVIHPRRKKDAPATVVFVRDTSGSVDGTVLSEFNAHIETAIAETGCPAVVIDADADILAEYSIQPGDEIPQQAKGGGGTDFRPAFVRVAEMADAGEQIAGVVYLTDLDGPQPDSSEFPTLWLSTTGKKAATGRTVHIK